MKTFYVLDVLKERAGACQYFLCPRDFRMRVDKVWSQLFFSGQTQWLTTGWKVHTRTRMLKCSCTPIQTCNLTTHMWSGLSWLRRAHGWNICHHCVSLSYQSQSGFHEIKCTHLAQYTFNTSQKKKIKVRKKKQCLAPQIYCHPLLNAKVRVVTSATRTKRIWNATDKINARTDDASPFSHQCAKNEQCYGVYFQTNIERKVQCLRLLQ